jgi:hypothetical protein
MANKTPYSIADQINLLKRRGVLFNDEQSDQFLIPKNFQGVCLHRIYNLKFSYSKKINS